MTQFLITTYLLIKLINTYFLKMSHSVTMYCSVEFENQSKIFVSGQEVKGVIKIENDAPKIINGIDLIIDGIAKTNWTETTGTGDDEKKTSYGATQQLILTKTPLIKNDGGK